MALYTKIVSPIPKDKPCKIDTLCSDALLTIVPSNSTGSNTATGLIKPVLDTNQSTSINFVSAVSSCHLKAIAFFGYLAVVPSCLPYSMSLYNNTKPSDRESGRQPRTVSDGFYKMLIYE